MKSYRRLAAAVVTVLLAAPMLTGCSGVGSGTSTSTSGAGTATDDTGSTTPAPVTRSLPSPSVTVPARTRTTLPAAPLDRPAQFGTGVTVDITGTKAMNVTGKGPGELSGPAVAFTLKLTNGTEKQIDVTRSVVTASYGDGVPANESSSAPSKPVRGKVKAHGSVTGTYVFLIPAEQHARVHLTISYDPTKPVVSLTGDLR